MEWLVCGIMICFGGVGYIVEYVMSGVDVCCIVVFCMILMVLVFGCVIWFVCEEYCFLFEVIVEMLFMMFYLYLCEFCVGKVVDVECCIMEGFVKGWVVIVLLGVEDGDVFEIFF